MVDLGKVLSTKKGNAINAYFEVQVSSSRSKPDAAAARASFRFPFARFRFP
jgi:hypothetical protein